MERRLGIIEGRKITFGRKIRRMEVGRIEHIEAIMHRGSYLHGNRVDQFVILPSSYMNVGMG